MAVHLQAWVIVLYGLRHGCNCTTRDDFAHVSVMVSPPLVVTPMMVSLVGPGVLIRTNSFRQ